MGRWAFTLGGLTLVIAHMMAIYLFASLADVTGAPGVWRLVGAGFSLACLACAAGLVVGAARRLRGRPSEEPARFLDQLGLLGAVVACPAIVWQSLAIAV